MELNPYDPPQTPPEPDPWNVPNPVQLREPDRKPAYRLLVGCLLLTLFGLVVHLIVISILIQHR